MTFKRGFKYKEKFYLPARMTIVVAVFIGIIIIISFIAYNIILRNAVFDFTDGARLSADQADKMIEAKFSEFYYSVDYLSRATTVKKNAERVKFSGTGDPQDDLGREIYLFYKDYLEVYGNLYDNISLVTKQGGYISTGREKHFLPDNADPREFSWYKTALKNEGKTVIFEPHRTVVGDGEFYAVKTVENDAGEIIGVQRIVVRLDFLTDILDKIKIKNKDETSFAIISANGLIIASSDRKDLLFEPLESLGVKESGKFSETKDGYFLIEIDGKKHEMTSYYLPSKEWKIISIIERDKLFGEQSLFLQTSIAVLVIIIIVLASVGFTIIVRKDYQDKLRNTAYYDSLTKIPNRSFILEEVQRIIENSQGKASFILCMLNMDNFKKINEALGHEAGDKLLCIIAEQLQAFCDENSENSLLARLNGDEFMIVIKDVPAIDYIEVFLEKIYLFANKPKSIYGQNFIVTMSAGIAKYPEHGNNMSALLRNVEMAIQTAKEAGGNTFAIFNENMAREMLEKIEMEAAILEAMKNKEFELYYQPKVDASQRKIKGLEALIRWNSPIYGFVPPNKFIPVAEQTGLIVELGKWVIKESFSFAKSIEEKGICVSCNVSIGQLLQVDFVDTVADAFKEYGLKRGNVSIEITESSLIESFGEVVKKLEQIRNNGVLIYLDDFGTGYSSLNYLKNLPINAVKIDKSFVDDIVDDKRVKGIFKAVVTMAHEIGLLVICEGIEKEEQVSYLLENNCNLIQGYYYSKPLPKNDVLDFIAKFN